MRGDDMVDSPTAGAEPADYGSAHIPFPAVLITVISNSAAPMLAVELSSERVLAASGPAGDLLPATGQSPVGLPFSAVVEPHRPGLLGTLLDGPLNGCSVWSDVVGAGQPIWLRVVRPAQHAPIALVLLSEQLRAIEFSTSTPEVGGSQPVIGATDSGLTIDRISDDVEPFLGLQPGELLGQSLLRLVHPDDLAGLHLALARTTGTEHGASLRVRLQHAGTLIACQMSLLALTNHPGCAFALQPVEDILLARGTAADVEQLLWRFIQAVEAVGIARELSDLRHRQPPGLSRLTARELEIVQRLQAGDRVPAIARSLYVAQSTVRNHLSAVFSKLGVSSQQELIVLLREAETLSLRA